VGNERFTYGIDAAEVPRLLDAIEQAADKAGIGVVATLMDTDPPHNVYVSPGAAAIFGRPAAEVIGESIFKYLPPDEVPRITEIARQRSMSEVPPILIETALVRPDGARVPIEVGSTRVNLAGRAWSVTFMLDISERKRIEEALRQSEARLRSVVEGAPDGVAILHGRTIAYLNPRAAQMLELADARTAVGTQITSYLEPAEAARAGERIGRLLATRERFAPTEYRRRNASGEVRVFEVASIPLDYAGSPALLAFIRDVTERKALEAQLLAADRLAAIGALATAVAHEANNPLCSVQLGLERLDREVRALGLPEARAAALLDSLREARRETARVAEIVADLRGFSRADEEGGDAVDLATVLERAIRLTESDVLPRARLTRRYEAAPPVYSNRTRLEQVFLSVLAHVARSLPDEEPERCEVLVVVGDGGDGTAYAQVSSRGADPPDAMDPSVARRIVEDAGGRLEVRDDDGGGMSVRVTLPAATQVDADASSLGPLADAALGRPRRRVLIVDDEPNLGRSLAWLLQPQHDAVTVTCGRDALAALDRGEAFDVILCDLMMPGMSGVDVYRAVRERHRGVEARIVFLTGGAWGVRMGEFLATVPNARLEKPFGVEELLGVIDAVRVD
jgi:PAS domain S-box-containing protein